MPRVFVLDGRLALRFYRAGDFQRHTDARVHENAEGGKLSHDGLGEDCRIGAPGSRYAVLGGVRIHHEDAGRLPADSHERHVAAYVRAVKDLRKQKFEDDPKGWGLW